MSDHLSRVPDVVDEILSIARAALPDGFQVLDGPVLGELHDAALVVGLGSVPDEPGYEANVVELEGYGRRRYAEEFTVRCFVTLTSGAATIATLRSQVRAHLEALDDALRDAPRDAGVWEKVGVDGRMEWVPVYHPGGATVTVFFAVAGTALL